MTEAFHRFPPATGPRPPLPVWALPELEATPELTDLTVWEQGEDSTTTTDSFVDQLQTLSPFRRRTPENQQGLLGALRSLIDSRGGTFPTRTVTSLVLARKRGQVG